MVIRDFLLQYQQIHFLLRYLTLHHITSYLSNWSYTGRCSSGCCYRGIRRWPWRHRVLRHLADIVQSHARRYVRTCECECMYIRVCMCVSVVRVCMSVCVCRMQCNGVIWCSVMMCHSLSIIYHVTPHTTPLLPNPVHRDNIFFLNVHRTA